MKLFGSMLLILGGALAGQLVSLYQKQKIASLAAAEQYLSFTADEVRLYAASYCETATKFLNMRGINLDVMSETEFAQNPTHAVIEYLLGFNTKHQLSAESYENLLQKLAALGFGDCKSELKILNDAIAVIEAERKTLSDKMASQKGLYQNIFAVVGAALAILLY